MECFKLDANQKPQCCLCGFSDHDVLNYGEFYQCGKTKCHYFCLLFSSKLVQNGKDHEGILGFCTKDIDQEIKRGRKLKCVYCREGGATVGCCIKSCKKSFHLPCGLKKGSLHQFFNSFESFCGKHRPVQSIPPEALREANKDCPICYDDVDTSNSIQSLWASCCTKRWFHRSCIQKQAVSAGYFFKCPVCNNKGTFSDEMKRMGIYIPEMDASWELVPNAFNDLLFTYNTCNVDPCKCPDGRNFSTLNGSWRIMRCNACGSQGTHMACSGFKLGVGVCSWRCPPCSSTLDKAESSLQATASTSLGSSAPPKRIKLDTSPSNLKAETEDEGSSSEEEDYAIVVDSDSDVEVLEVVPSKTVATSSALLSIHAEKVNKELRTNEGKTIKVHKVEAIADRIPSVVGELGGLVVKSNSSSLPVGIVKPHPNSSASSSTSKGTVNVTPQLLPRSVSASELVNKSGPAERVQLRLGSAVSLFPVPSTSLPSAPKIPKLKEVMITPVPSTANVHSTTNQRHSHLPVERILPLGSVQSTMPSSSRISVTAHQGLHPDNSISGIKIQDVRHSNERIPSLPPGQILSQGQIFPILYYPVTTNDGTKALQPMILSDAKSNFQQVIPFGSLPMTIPMSMASQSTLPISDPDVVTLD